MKKIRKLTVLFAVLALMLSFSTVAYAGGSEEMPEEPEDTTATGGIMDETEDTTTFTPDGTGTVVDSATDEDGKEFYTIITPDENVFYLIIDRQRETENVYFLDAVTEKDLLALAEASGDTVDGGTITEPEVTTDTTEAPEDTTEQASTETQGNNTGTLILVLAVVLLGGGVGYYFKIYRPKQQRADSEDDYDYNGENDYYGAEDMEEADDLPPWEDEDGGDDKA